MYAFFYACFLLCFIKFIFITIPNFSKFGRGNIPDTVVIRVINVAKGYVKDSAKVFYIRKDGTNKFKTSTLQEKTKNNWADAQTVLTADLLVLDI